MSDKKVDAASVRAERREAFAEDVRKQTGINDAMIARLVRAFYTRIQSDPLLAPIFADHVTDWEPHLERMTDFWSSVVLMSGRYHGSPMRAHATLPVDRRHFDQWLALFETSAREVCPEMAAGLFIEKAKLIASSLELGVASVRGEVLMPGERLHPVSGS